MHMQNQREKKEMLGCNHVVITPVCVSSAGRYPCNINNQRFPWSREIKAAVCSKLHLIIALEEVGRGSPIQPRYIQVTMTTAQCGVVDVWTKGGENNVRGGFPWKERQGKSMRRPFQGSPDAFIALN